MPSSTPSPPAIASPSPLAQQPTPSRQPPAALSPLLAQALAFAPADAYRVFFNDWQRIKADAGQEHLSGRSPFRARLDFMMTRGLGWDIMSLCAALRLEQPQAHWGWDITDAQWDASIQLANHNTVCVVAFPPAFDLAPTLALYRERGFHETRYRDTTVLTQTGALVPEGLWKDNAALLNVALLPDGHQLLLAANADDLYPVLDAVHRQQPTLASDLATSALATNIGAVSSVMLLPAPAPCEEYRLSKLLIRPQATVLRKLLETAIGPSLRALHDYDALALGYRAEGGSPIVLLGFAYQTAALAAADTEPRSQIVEHGLSLNGHRPLAERFTFDGATAQEETLVLRMRNVRRQLGLFQMMATRDMLIAACPG